MKVSLIQMNTRSDRAENLAQAKALMEAAIAADRPDLLVLPEHFEYAGGTTADKLAAADRVPGGAAYEMAREVAKANRVWVHAGSLLERIEGDSRIYNTTVVFDRSGREVARYRKIHLFDVTAPDGTPYNESATIRPGEDIVLYDLEGLTVGCAICYDLRFGELFITLGKRGADVIVLPAAFTLQTGKDHWEVLCRARAIETQTYFLAAAQWGSFTGPKGDTRYTYGHSMVVDPWGHVIARASDGTGHVTATIDPAQIARVRSLIPMNAHRRLGVSR
ncbi:MAG TPA: carbon-nitrogen hydrolase family protein [Thermodesulfobacteriota bacterium]